MRALLLILVLLLLFITSCNRCDCPEPAPWSFCDKHSMRFRTNYECNDCTPIVEQESCVRYIQIEGGKRLVANLSPAKGVEVKGEINLAVMKSSRKTTKFQTFIFPSEIHFDGEITPEIQQRSIILVDTTPEDGWTGSFDTNRLVNGEYTVLIGVKEGDEWIEFGKERIVIIN